MPNAARHGTEPHACCEQLGRKKLVLLTWVGADVPARDRGRVAEQRSALRASLPSMHVHLELQANTAAEAEHAAIVERVKASYPVSRRSFRCAQQR